MKPTRLIKITGIIAMSGLVIVLLMILATQFFSQSFDRDLRNSGMVIGFALMLLGTLWKVVLEMNSEDET